MTTTPDDLRVRVATPGDLGAVARLRWGPRARAERGFEQRIAAWLADEGDRRTIWLAELSGEAVGFASMLEYRRMPRPDRPDRCWGYVANMQVREDVRNRGIGAALLEAVIAAAAERGYIRLVLAPTDRAVPFYRRAGFVVPDEQAGEHRLLVRPMSSPRDDRPST
jgi:GNAT superfamily N-acetyltransferase